MSIVVTHLKEPLITMLRIDGEAGPVVLFSANLLTGEVTSDHLTPQQRNMLGEAINDLRGLMPVNIGADPAIVACAPTVVKSLFSLNGLNLGAGPFTLMVSMVGPVATVQLSSLQNVPGTPEYFLLTLPHSISGPLVALPASVTGVP